MTLYGAPMPSTVGGPRSFADVLAGNIRGVRALQGLSQDDVAARMVALGYDWHRATVSAVERGTRRVTAEELLGLALVFEMTIPALIGVQPGNARPVQVGDLVLPAKAVNDLTSDKSVHGYPIAVWDETGVAQLGSLYRGNDPF